MIGIKMKVIRHENVVLFDIDSTLIMHVDPNDYYEAELIEVGDPLNPLKTIRVLPNAPMIRLLQEEHHRGSFIVIWSRGGYEWAESVVFALGFDKWEKLVVMSKALAYFDDKPVEEWLSHRVYLKPDEIYKNKG